MLETILKGVAIGLLISVPLGPIGMLIIQRTLIRGRAHGIVTGLGATTSDLIYTIVSFFFLGFVMDFLDENRYIIQIIGSVIVIGFGTYIFRSNPSTQPKVKTDKSTAKLSGDYFSSFVLTLSNPLILFFLIALFAKLSFLEGRTNIWQDLTGMISILGGATLWWGTLTYFVGKFRYMFNLRGLKVLNQTLGTIIILLGIIGLLLKNT